jgi:hypothetical protein
MTLPRFRFFLATLLLAAGWTAPVLAQDTRGSLIFDTPVALVGGGTVLVQDLNPGTVIWTWNPPAAPVPGKVTAVRRQNTDNYYWLKAGDRQVQATGSHRIVLASGKVVRLDAVKAGDLVWVWTGSTEETRVVTSVRVLPATMVAYDLTVEGHRFFQVDGIIVAD